MSLVLAICKHYLKRLIACLAFSQFNSSCSGATCVLAVVTDSQLVVAHCGDSKAVLGQFNGSADGSSSSAPASGGSIAYSAQPLTEDHKPNRPDEHKRIVSAGGRVGSRQQMEGKAPGGSQGPCRVWYKHGKDTLGLAMSRSLGDAAV